ncbi:MAG: hypothetical protein E6G32_09685 [Actinobacteria bacterium]|nr:MAG: hypothetical protein E6G32_09685 [Actinomycetota bacterium]
MKRLHRMAGDERGFALVLALGITVVLSMTVVTVVESTTANSRASVQSKNRVSAYNLAEAGVNNASAILRNASNSYDPHVLHPQPPNQPTDCASPPASPAGSPLLGNTCSPFVFNLDGGTATVSGVFDSSSTNWTVTSTGQTRNPYGGQATTRTLTAIIHIRAQAAQNNVVPAWNYVFVKDTTPNVCNVTLDQTTALTASLYTEGNLCFKNQASISETNAADPVSLEVRGKLVWLSGASKGVGQSSPLQQISSAKIGGGCATGAVTNTAHTCTTSSPYNDYFYVKPGGYDTNAPAITSPAVTSTDWDGYYQSASISRLSPCLSGGLAGTAFDNDTVRNNSLPATFNLTPSTNYTCQTKDLNGSVIGELDWDATNHLLSIRGNVFIDGNVSINGVVKYRGVNYKGLHPAGSDGSDGLGGEMVMYVSGTVSLTNGGVFCGWNTTTDTSAYNGSTCDFSAWTPSTSMFMFVAGGGVTLGQSSYFQGAIFTPGNLNLGQSSQTEGPSITGSITLGQSVQMKPLPGLADLPLGAPGNPNTSGVPAAPVYTNG